MKVSTKKKDNYEQEVTIEFAAEELEKSKKEAVKRLGARVNIQGFRKGKVPAPILERHLGKGVILDEAADILIDKGAHDYIDQEKIIPVTRMKSNIITCEDGKDFVFTLTFTPYPEVTLGEYKNIDVEKVVEPVTDKDVDEYIDSIRNRNAEMIDAEENDTVADGDFITLDFEGSIDGEKFDGGTGKDHPLTIGSNTFIDNFEEQLIGAKVGEERDVKVTFPEDYHVKDLAEKPAVFKCKINSLKHKKLPELDEEFVKKISKFETVEDFKADVHKNLERRADAEAIDNQREKVIEKAVENMTVDIPPVMIEDRITNMINEFEARLQTQGMKLEQYMSVSGLDDEKMREDYRETAEKNLRTDILLDTVAKEEKLKVESDDFNKEIAYMAMLYRTTPRQIAKILKENDQFPNVAANILRAKAMEFIFDNMKGAEKKETSDEKAGEEKNSGEQSLFEETETKKED